MPSQSPHLQKERHCFCALSQDYRLWKNGKKLKHQLGQRISNILRQSLYSDKNFLKILVSKTGKYVTSLVKHPVKNPRSSQTYL